MSDEPIRSNIRTFVLRDGGLPLEERTVELGLEPIVIDDTPRPTGVFLYLRWSRRSRASCRCDRKTGPPHCWCRGCNHRQRPDICMG